MISKIKKQISLFLKEKILNHYLISFSRTECDGILVKYLKKKPINYIDIGASSGEFAKNVKKYFGFKKALLIEPIPCNVDILKNAFNNVLVCQCAVSDKAEKKMFNWYKFHYSSSLLNTLEGANSSGRKNKKFLCKKIPVQVKTLDSILKSYRFQEKIDLLKIDVQGSELDVLRGAKNCLEKAQFIFLEVSFKKIYKKACLFYEIDSFLKKKSFMLVSLQEGYRNRKGELIQADALYKKQ